MKNLLNSIERREKMWVALALILVVVGIVIVAVTASNFREAIEEEQDAQLKNLIDTVDFNISESITRFDDQMVRFTESDRFEAAVAVHDEEGGAASMKALMQNSFISNTTSFEAMLIFHDGEMEISTIEGKDYSIGRKIKGNIYSCTDSVSERYLALRYKVGNHVYCYGIVDIESIYYTVVQRANAPSESIMLLLPSTGMVIGQKDGNVFSSPEGGDNEAAGTEESNLRGNQRNGKSNALSYEKKTDDGNRTMRVISVPAETTKNGIFAISASSDYDVIEALARGTARKFILGFAFTAMGLLLAMFIFLRVRREMMETDRELEELKEKNRQMEELSRKTQELAHHQRLETIGTLTSSIAHEFNNLLTPIMGYSLMTLEKLPQDESVYDDVLEIYNASVKAKDIISRLSELSRKNTEMKFQTINPDELVNKVLHVTSPALPKNVDIFRNLNCADKYVEGNETQISQLILNLIINAFQALGERGGEVRVTTEKVGSDILFEVADNGPGISDDIKEKIFDPFFTTKESGAGTGLGLAIALQAAEDHKGRIEVDSEEGKGTKFRVFIPELELDPDMKIWKYED